MRAALRAIARTPGSSAAVVLTCALALAASGTIFAIARAVILRPLPFADPDSLVWVWATRVDRDRAFFSLPDFLEQRRDAAPLADLVAISNWGANLDEGSSPRRLQGVRTTANALEVLGVAPAAGRVIARADEAPAAASVAMLSFAVWREQFGADPSIVGRTIRLNDAPFEVVGILPRDFLIPGSDTDVLTALRPDVDPRRTDYDTNFLRVIARLHHGSSWGALSEQMAETNARLRREFPGPNAKKTDPRVLMLATEEFGAYRLAFGLLFLCGALMILLTGANLAHVMLARLPSTERAARVRLMLGAPRTHVARIVLAEPLVLMGAAGAGALAALAWIVPAAAARVPQVPRAADARVDAVVVFAVLGTALAAGLAAGAIPLRRLFRHDGAAMNASQRTMTTRSVAGKRLLGAEIAICLTLLSTALVALASLRALLGVDTGVRDAGVVTVRASLPAARYPAPAFDAFMTRVLDDLRSRPGVEAAGATNVLPLSAMNVRTDFEIVGHPSRSAAEVPGAQNRWVTPGYFEAVGIPILRGRTFTAADGRGGGLVVVVDAILARQFWGDRDPVGERIMMSSFAPGTPWTIVGLVGGVKHQSVDEPPTGTLYAPMTQAPAGVLPFLVNGISVAARSPGFAPGASAGRRARPDAAAAALTSAIRSQDAAIPVTAAQPLTALIDSTLAARRLTAWLAALLAAVALAIGIFGIAAVTAALVVDRRRELAIRLAIGASPRRVYGSLLGEVTRVTAAGLVAGIAGASLLHAVFARVFFTGALARPAGEAAAVVIVACAALAGAAVPAWKATRIDAVDVLRNDG